ncbi:MAG: cell envelope integrity protein TolA [Hydrogenophilaceae bacterium]
MNRAVARDQLSAGGLALLVHLFFFLALVFGVSWKTLPHVPVYADLWNALPTAPAPPAPLPPEPAPAPEPVKPLPVKPPPPKPADLPKAAPPERKADIALKEKKAAEKKRQAEEEKKHQDELKKQRLEEDRKRQDAERRRKLEEEMQRAEQERMVQEERQLQVRREEARKAAEVKRQAQEKARKAMEEQLAAAMDDELAAETQAIQQQAAVSARLKAVDEYKGRIQLKIKGLLINPPTLNGKPEAVYRVDLLPNGEVTRATLVKSSGQPAYDRAVESAILKASPLPLPPDRDAAAAFRDGLELKFRPD